MILTDSLQTLHFVVQKRFTTIVKHLQKDQQKVAHHFSRLWLQQLHESTSSGSRWSCGGGVHWVLLTVISLRWRGRRPLRYPWSRGVALGRVCWCVSACQGEGLLLEFLPILTWHSACEFQHPLEEAYPLLFPRVMCYCLWTGHQMVCWIFHNAHDLVQLWWGFIFITVCSVISSFLGSSCGRGKVENRNFGRCLSPRARAALMPTIIGLLVRRVFRWRSRCCPSSWSVTLLVKRFQIGEVCKLPLLASC